MKVCYILGEINLLVYGQDSIKNTVGRSANFFFFSILRIDIMERKNIFSEQTKKKNQ